MAMTQPNVYWTLATPYATIIGLYTNVPVGGYVDDKQKAWLIKELVVTLSAFRLFGISRPLLVVAKPLLGRKQWVGEYVRH
jgi:hypothetical protein